MSSCFAYCILSKSRAASNGSRQESSELLVLGLEGAGKSLLMRQIYNVANSVQKAIPRTQPTVGVELYKLNLRSKYSRQVTRAREIGGCMRPVWPQYFACANLFLYVISINATGLLATAVIELHNLLIHPDVKVILLILNTDCVY
ncbi:TPA: ADP-ribosylation factor-like protein 16 [Trebouxia sp. C0006]